MTKTRFAQHALLCVAGLTLVVVGIVTWLGGGLALPGLFGNLGARPSLAKVGSLAPEIALRDLDGGTVKLTDLAGQPVLVTFWATWCGPCRSEMPTFEKKYQQDFLYRHFSIRRANLPSRVERLNAQVRELSKTNT